MIEKVLETIKLHKKLVDEFEKKDINKIIKIAEVIVDSFKNGHRVYICGNGGSAADSQHLAGELIGRFHKLRKALPAVALTVDTSVITCIANDFNYGEIFKRQLEALLCTGDVLLLFSTSGRSNNIIEAARYAHSRKALIISFTGKPGSELQKISEINLSVNSGFTCRIQEIHQIAYHIICDLIDSMVD